MNAVYLLISILTIKLVENIHTRVVRNFLNCPIQINKHKTIKVQRYCRRIKQRSNKLFLSLFDEYDEKCIKALIMAREVAKNDHEKEILLKHLLISIIRIDCNLIEHILKFFNVSLTTFLDKFNMEINKTEEDNAGSSGNDDDENTSENQDNKNSLTRKTSHQCSGHDQVISKNLFLPSNDTNEANLRKGETGHLAYDQDDDQKVVENFIDKHIQDIEDKINQLKNLENESSDISTTDDVKTDKSLDQFNESDNTTTDNIILQAANRVIGSHGNDQDSIDEKIIKLEKTDSDELSSENSEIRFSQNCKRVLQNAVLEARRKKKMFVNVTDILIALINMAEENNNCAFLKYLNELNISVNNLKSQIMSYDERNSSISSINMKRDTTDCSNAHLNVHDTYNERNNYQSEQNHNMMEKNGEDQRMRNSGNEHSNRHLMNNLSNDYLNQTREFKNYEENNIVPNSKIINSSFIKDCLIDMVQAAYEKGDEHFFGRKKEIKRIIEILGRKKKSNPLLIGESGVGKTAIIEHLSYLILKDKVPYHLRNCRIYQLNVGNIVAGTKYRGEFEEKMKYLLNNMNKKKKNILFIDEIHVIVGAGSGEGSLDASNLLKPFLSSDNLQCIGTTTFQEYSKYIESDKALRRRFNCVPVQPFTSKETLLLLKKIKYNYEKYHNIYYTNDSLKSIVLLTEDYLPTANFPDKAIDILDEAGAYQKIRYEIFMRQKLRNESLRKAGKVGADMDETKAGNVKPDSDKLSKNELDRGMPNDEPTSSEILNKESNENFEAENYIENMHMKYVTSDVIEDIVSKKSSISYIKKNKKEEEKIMKLKEKLNKVIIGQEKVIDVLSKYLFKAITNIKDPNKPIGTLLLCGSSGVGKTLCAQVISKYLFNEDNLIVINMNEYIDKHSVSKLFGSYPGYVGYKEGGELTESVKKKPFSIILFDEIEKAHSEVLHVLLQILDNGILTDSKGNKVSFKNTFIFMTTNIGSDIITDYFKLYNKNYSNLGFRYYLKKRKKGEEANLAPSSIGENQQNFEKITNDKMNESNVDLSSTNSTTKAKDYKTYQVENPVNLPYNRSSDSYEIFEEKLRTNKWYDELQPEIEEELKKKFLPEFLNRIDEKIIFRQFLKRDVINIFENMTGDLKKRIKKRKNLNLVIDKEVINYICSDDNNIYDMNFGARSIRRALYKYLEDPIASFLISNLYEPNDTIHITLSNDNQINVHLLKTSIQQLVS